MLFTGQKHVKYYKKASKKSLKIVPEIYSYKKIVLKMMYNFTKKQILKPVKYYKKSFKIVPEI